LILEEKAMPIEHKISSDGLFVHTVVEGTITNKDLISHVMEILTNTRLVPRYKELFDGTLVAQIKVDKQGIDQVAELIKLHHQKTAGSKCAIVVVDAKAFELAEYFEELARPIFFDVIVFNSVATARTWLGIGENVMI
jgi:hypothetical protein